MNNNLTLEDAIIKAVKIKKNGGVKKIDISLSNLEQDTIIRVIKESNTLIQKLS